MASNKKPYQKKKIQSTYGGGFGKYQENTGGGDSPNGNAKPGTHGHGVNSDYRQENNDTMQPRTSDGKFTYKSVNGKSIDPKYGPSRGKTVNPLLTGGVNGIKISDVESQFASEQGSYWDKYKDKWYQKGSEIVTSDGKTRVAAKAVWEVAKESYNEVTGEFGGNIKATHKLGNGGVKSIGGQGGTAESNVFDEVKRGRKTAEEQKAQQQALKTGKEQGVISKQTGGLKVKPGVQTNVAPAPQPAPKQQLAPSTPASTPAPQPAPKTPEAPKSNLKYSPENFQAVTKYMQEHLGKKSPEKAQELIGKFNKLTDEQKVKQIDSWKSKGTNFGF